MLRASGFGHRSAKVRVNRSAAQRAQQLDAVAGWGEFSREIDRSRRYRHHLVIVRVRPTHVSEEVLEIAEALRSTDAVWIEEPYVYVLLRESDRTMGDALLYRLAIILPHLFADGAQMASFPEDGVTSGALLAVLESRPDPVEESESRAEDELAEALAPRRYLDEAGLAPQKP
ncbi:MAG TPA: hypothetical protein VFK76_00845 [Gaiellaceae bacterium]|nr:hypothetical protein [Gaiellaceae bacterium]